MHPAEKPGKPARRLGRGLSSLISDPVAVPTQPEAKPSSKHTLTSDPVSPAEERGGVEAPKAGAADKSGVPEGMILIPVSRITPSRFQPRSAIEPESLVGLASSIKRSGLMQPVIVRPSGGDYELVAGERRWRAAMQAGLSRVPAVVRPLSDAESAEWAVVENLQREDLNPMDRAHALKSLHERFGLSHADVAERVGLERATVANLIRLTELEDVLAALVSGGKLNMGHGRALLAAAAGAVRLDLGARAAAESWSVRRLEREVRLWAERVLKGGGVASDRRAESSAGRARLEKQLSEHLGTKVAISTDRSGKKGRVTIEFYGLDHFDGLMSKLGFSTRET